MLKRLALAGMIVSLLPAPSFAQSILALAERAVAAELQRPASQGRNPHATPAIVLMGAGASLVALAFIAPSGVSCEDTGRNLADISCGTHANKGLLFTGIGAAGVGVFLWMKGDRQRQSQPSVAPTAGGFVVRQRFSF